MQRPCDIIQKDNFRAERERQCHCQSTLEQFAARDRPIGRAVIRKVQTIGAAGQDALNRKGVPALARG